MANEELQIKIRKLMDDLFQAQIEFVSQAPNIIPFKGPHYGVHIRIWNESPGITIECDPGYCGIGSSLSSDEARGLGEALIREANTADAKG
jgi:hypothetical protein